MDSDNDLTDNPKVNVNAITPVNSTAIRIVDKCAIILCTLKLAVGLVIIFLIR